MTPNPLNHATNNQNALTHSNTSTAVTQEMSTRARAALLRSVIIDSQCVELVIALAITGDNLRINRDGTIEKVDDEPLDQGIRAKYLTLLTNKVLSPPKPVSDKTEDNHSKWIEALDKADEAKRESSDNRAESNTSSSTDKVDTV